MMTTIETYVRPVRNSLRKWTAEPAVRRVGAVALRFGAGLVLSAGGLAQTSMPMAMGLVLALTGWRAAVAAAGSAAGYLLFWGSAGYQGVLWTFCGLLAALGLGKRRILDESPLLMSAIGAVTVAATGLAFQLFFQDRTSVPQYLLRVFIGALSAKLFELVRERRDPVADWLAVGAAVLGLEAIAPFGLSLGCVAAGAVASAGTLPAAALAGLALDLSRFTGTSMTAVLCLAALTRSAGGGKQWVRWAAPGAVYLLVSGLSGQRDPIPFFGLAIGGAVGALLPVVPELTSRRGGMGLMQVRLELMAGVLSQTQQLLLEENGIPIDEEALLLRTQQRACGSCPNRKTCRERLQPLPRELLHSPLVEVSSLSIPCKKPGRLILELRRTQEQLRLLRADRERQREYRRAVIQQYGFLASFLQQQAETLPRRRDRLRQRYTVEVTVCTAGREAANGDRCVCFTGPGCRHYILLCDGMGTGLGAAQEGQSATQLLQRMLTAGFPAESSLRSINSMLVLLGRAAAVTVDLAEIQLDSGRVNVYKWGAAPSWRISPFGTEKIGTATPPPGLSVSEGRETVERLSLRRGEVLIMTSDGVDAEGAWSRMERNDALPPGELAARLLEQGARDSQDDATVAAVRLLPGAVST